MADLNLPPPVALAPPVADPVPTSGAIPPGGSQAAPAVETGLTEDEVMQRVSNALNKLGIDPTTVKAHIVAQLEAAAAAYESAVVGNDKNLWQAQGVRLLAAFHAVVG
jgi:hypothetical protein